MSKYTSDEIRKIVAIRADYLCEYCLSTFPMPQAQIAENLVSKKFYLSQSFVLKACIFATGLAGIVAEYVIATIK